MSLLHPFRIIVHVVWNSGESRIQEQISNLRFLEGDVMLEVRFKHVTETNPCQSKNFNEILLIKLSDDQIVKKRWTRYYRKLFIGS